MTPCRLLIILGAFLALLTVVLSCPTPDFEPDMDYFDCRFKAQEILVPIRRRVNNEFSAEEKNETLRMLNETRNLDSKHFCRKKDVLVSILGEAAESLKHLSSKSVHMVPFVEHMYVFALNKLCENDAELLSVFIDENNKNCTRDRWTECKSHIDAVGYLEQSAFCDFVDPECGDPYTPQLMCQKFLDFMECANGEDIPCSEQFRHSMWSVISALRNSDYCSKYF